MGAVIVHNTDDEPVILRGALVLVWDALVRPGTEMEIRARLGRSEADEIAPRIRQAVTALEAAGLAVRAE